MELGGHTENKDKIMSKTIEKCCLPNDAGDSSSVQSVTQTWLTTHVNNNNNSLESNNRWLCQSCEASTSANVTATTTASSSSAAGILVMNDARLNDFAGSVEDEGGGGGDMLSSEQLNGADISLASFEEGAAAAGYGCYAAALTSPDKSHSNRTSMNNSTENLSCCSDNFYGNDDIILLDDVDADADEVSLNSDDCVYAYRGDGVDFDINLAVNALHGAGAVACDDETDFLEMDYEPDPLSEVECGSIEPPPPSSHHLNEFIMQRNISSHVSGRHSANFGLRDSVMERQLFSSPIDDLPPPKALQSQSMLSKNLARISLHLDQIKGGDPNECDRLERRGRDERPPSLAVLTDTVGMAPVLAQSLPNTLNSTFAHVASETEESSHKSASPSKVTGAKPKRFSTSSSNSSKQSKSRQSIRSVSLLPAFGCGSTSFDERSVSCTEFRSVPPDTGLTSGAFSLIGVPNDEYSSCDETCLDCLEKEFITSTVGQSPGIECPKCRKHSSTISLYTRTKEYGRCRSDSPPFFGTDYFFEAPEAHVNLQKPEGRTARPMKLTASQSGGAVFEGLGAQFIYKNRNDCVDANQRTMCDKVGGNLLLKNLTMTEPEIVAISTLNLTEETLVQALDKLQVISYNVELIQAHFSSSSVGATGGNRFKNLAKFLLHESKKNCNYMKVKRLIELSTRHVVRVKFKQDPSIPKLELVPVKVTDILHLWGINPNINVLKKLDKRFQDANVLGKVANIIRLSAQRGGSTRRSMPDSIMIPQYYPSGHLLLTKIC